MEYYNRDYKTGRLCCKPAVGVNEIRTTTVLSSCFCAGQTSCSNAMASVRAHGPRPKARSTFLVAPTVPFQAPADSYLNRDEDAVARPFRRVRGWRASFRVRWYNPIKGIPSLSFRSSVRLPWPRFQAPAHQSGRADFPHPAFGRDHEFAHGRSRVVFPRQIRPWSRHSFTLEKRTYFPDLTLCFRQNHWRSRFVACWSITA